MDLGLKGKTAIITGGNSHIGRGITLAFAKEGANVVIAARDEEAGQKVVELAKKQGVEGLMVKTDISKWDDVEAMVKKTLDRFGQIDVLVNNASWVATMFFIDCTPDYWDKIIDINFKGVLNCCRLVLPHMIEREKLPAEKRIGFTSRIVVPLEGIKILNAASADSRKCGLITCRKASPASPSPAKAKG